MEATLERTEDLPTTDEILKGTTDYNAANRLELAYTFGDVAAATRLLASLSPKENTNETFLSIAMRQAAGRGQLDFLRWLYARHPEMRGWSYTRHAGWIRKAALGRHEEAVDWLRATFASRKSRQAGEVPPLVSWESLVTDGSATR